MRTRRLASLGVRLCEHVSKSILRERRWQGIPLHLTLYQRAISPGPIAYTALMSTNLKPEELPGLVDKGLAMVEKRLSESNGARIYDSIKAQLTYMKQTIEAK